MSHYIYTSKVLLINLNTLNPSSMAIRKAIRAQRAESTNKDYAIFKDLTRAESFW
jgi:hypothetical protein